MNELKNRGVEDILIFAVDNLTGTSDAIESVYPKAEIQKCIVHQIRNSLKYVPWKERKTVAADLKKVYKASTEQEALMKLLYPAVRDMSRRWTQRTRNWGSIYSQLCIFFEDRLAAYIE